MFRAVPKEPGVPVQTHSPQSAATNTKGPSKADRLTADKAPRPFAKRRNSDRAGEGAGDGPPCGGCTVESEASAMAFPSVLCWLWVFIVRK